MFWMFLGMFRRKTILSSMPGWARTRKPGKECLGLEIATRMDECFSRAAQNFIWLSWTPTEHRFKTTWMHPRSKHWHPIDYITVPSAHRPPPCPLDSQILVQAKAKLLERNWMSASSSLQKRKQTSKWACNLGLSYIAPTWKTSPQKHSGSTSRPPSWNPLRKPFVLNEERKTRTGSMKTTVKYKIYWQRKEQHTRPT